MLRYFINFKLCSSYLSFTFSFTSFALLLNPSFLKTVLDTTALFWVALVEFANSSILLAFHLSFCCPVSQLLLLLLLL